MENYAERRRIQNLNAQRKWREKRKGAIKRSSDSSRDQPLEYCIQAVSVQVPDGEQCESDHTMGLYPFSSCHASDTDREARSALSGDQCSIPSYMPFTSSHSGIASQTGRSGRDSHENMSQTLANWESLMTIIDGNNLEGGTQTQNASDQEAMERAVNILRKQRQTLNQKAEEIFAEVMELYKHGVLLELFQEDHAFQHQLAAIKQRFLSLT
ncbi:hypothetical protein BO78DRAFT_428845 [Aspergillus sclerotiicarbonarius CBS 121057]|uniref:BZIP domain-containing protein n=1 Tax=Aspergillus sclerotiicarbonarius (strain CBS 121057 / IBT 28362) TaxID=1448318 RepID=A0A319ETT5_ASPSB|nr:hypothetical protein BO78DRAFT_428845 [Aspergillus sclerotiicarbonarius CBS 121057]